MAQPGTDQHQRRVTIRESSHHASAPADLPIEPLNDIVGSDPSPVFRGKIAVSQRFINTVLYLLSRLFQLHFT